MDNLDFSELGLTNNEAKAYESLILLGKSSAAEISKHSGVPYGRIYTVLDSLQEKGLTKIIPEETKKFIPSNPQELETYIQKKKARLDELQKNIGEYKTIYQEYKEDAVHMAYGKRNFHKIAMQMKKALRTNYSIKYTFDLDPNFIEGTKKGLGRSVDYKALGKIDKETEKNVRIWKKVQPNIKHIPNDGVAIGINDDEEVLLGLIKSNVTLLIKDKAFGKMMGDLFRSYYETH